MSQAIRSGLLRKMSSNVRELSITLAVNRSSREICCAARFSGFASISSSIFTSEYGLWMWANSVRPSSESICMALAGLSSCCGLAPATEFCLGCDAWLVNGIEGDIGMNISNAFSLLVALFG